LKKQRKEPFIKKRMVKKIRLHSLILCEITVFDITPMIK
jgi:hypothetical protein